MRALAPRDLLVHYSPKASIYRTVTPHSAMNVVEPGSFLPLTPVAFEVLLSLAGGDAHGYRILRDIEERTGGRLRLHPGTLYRAIARLVEQGLLEEQDEQPHADRDDERRRYYGLTELGRRVAAAEASRLEAQLRHARATRLFEPAPARRR